VLVVVLVENTQIRADMCSCFFYSLSLSILLGKKQLVAHKIYGIPATINCANYVYFLALTELTKIPNPAMLTIFTGTLRPLLDQYCIENLSRVIAEN